MMQDPKQITDILSSGNALAILGLICFSLLVMFVLFGKKLLAILQAFLSAMVQEGRNGNKSLAEIKNVMEEHLDVVTEIREGTRTTVRQMEEWGKSDWLKEGLDDLRNRMESIHADVLRQKGAKP